jgi:hypothetical protein
MRSQLVRTLVAVVIVIVIGLGALVVWGFLEGRSEVEREAERERPVKEPLRISMRNGVPMITLDDHTQQSSGIETTSLMSAPYQERVRAYAMVLDVARLTDLSNKCECQGSASDRPSKVGRFEGSLRACPEPLQGKWLRLARGGPSGRGGVFSRPGCARISRVSRARPVGDGVPGMGSRPRQVAHRSVDHDHPFDRTRGVPAASDLAARAEGTGRHPDRTEHPRRNHVHLTGDSHRSENPGRQFLLRDAGGERGAARHERACISTVW